MEILKGVVIAGKKEGRLLGFPTANIKVASVQAPGIYAGQIMVGEQSYQAALYLAGNDIIEAYIFDFSGDLYGREVEVSLVKKIRETQVFKNDQEAKSQITKDVEDIKKVLQHE